MESGQTEFTNEVRCMIKKILLFLPIFVFWIASGCSSATIETKTNSATGNASNSQNGSNQTVVNSANGNTSPTVAESIPVVENQPDITVNNPKLNKDRKLVDTPGAAHEPTRVPAAGNSEIASTMDKQGNFVETRYFKGNQSIERVERTWLGPNNTSLKITLKGGKVLTISGDKISDFGKTPITTFLELAGVKAPAISAPGTGVKTN